MRLNLNLQVQSHFSLIKFNRLIISTFQVVTFTLVIYSINLLHHFNTKYNSPIY